MRQKRRALGGLANAPRSAVESDPERVTRVYGRMGYIIALVAFLVVVPLLFVLLTRKSAGVGGIDSRKRGITVSEPSSDQPSPGAADARGASSRETERRIPPG